MSCFFYVSDSFPPVPGGSSVINQNLLEQFNQEEFFILTTYKIGLKKGLQFKLSNTIYLNFELLFLPNKLAVPSFLLARIITRYRLLFIAKIKSPKAIVVAYPQLVTLDASQWVSEKLNIPFFPYLHDTIVESLSDTPLEKYGNKVQSKVFRTASHIFVMSEGMQRLYEGKYNIKTTPILHIYPEEFTAIKRVTNESNQVFWGGAIYRINHVALSRLLCVCKELSLDILCATNPSEKMLEKFSYPLDTMRFEFYSNRKDYIDVLKTNKFLLLALNWPEETSVDRDEISTIFPTKVAEYLNSGVPIIVHCPEHYFMAKFFMKYDCGLVLGTRDSFTMKSKIQSLLQDGERLDQLVTNAGAAADMFRPEINSGILKKFLSIRNI